MKQYFDDPENVFRGNGKTYKENVRIAELEGMVGRLYAENEFLKKALTALESRIGEERKEGCKCEVHARKGES